MTFCSKRCQFATVLILGIVISCGCSVLPHASSTDLADEMQADQAAPANYYVEMHPSFGKPKIYTGTITEPTTVQTALELSGAYESVRRPQVDLYRVLPGGQPPLKLPVGLKGKLVRYEQDYAVHPNDRIVVRQTSHNALDKIVDSLIPGS